MANIFVFSGEDIISSRKAFLEHLESLKTKNFEIIRLSGKELSEESLALLSLPSSLFGLERVLAIENLLSGQKAKEKEKIIQIISQFSGNLVVWEGKDFSKTEQLRYPNFIFKNFKVPQVLFNFMDSFSPGNTENNLRLFRQTVENTEPNFIFLMIIRQIRLLILAKTDRDLLKLAPWQISKIEKQAKLFSLDLLKEINKKLLLIDYSQKTSGLPFTLKEQLELLLTEI